MVEAIETGGGSDGTVVANGREKIRSTGFQNGFRGTEFRGESADEYRHR